MRALLALTFSLVISASAAFAQGGAANYPNRPIHIIVCVPAGGGVDTVTRVIAKGMEKELGQPVVVENHSGASGNIGASLVYHSNPDGYTLLAAQPAPLTVNPVLYKSMNFDPTKFEPVAIMSSAPNVLLVRPKFPAKTAKEFMAYAKAHPGELNYASQGIGTTSHLTTALFERKTGIKMVHIPFKGTTPALNALIGGHVDLIFMELAKSIKLNEAGRARILAAATAKRIPGLPNVPTFEQLGVKGFESGTWNAIAAPPKTPKAIVAKLNKAVNEALKSQQVKALFAKLDLHEEGGTPAHAKTFIVQQTKLWDHVIKEAHIPTR